jgi:hypothetical protein
MQFFVGLHQPHDAQHFQRAFISINRLRRRQSAIPVQDWILDSGAFSTVSKHGGYPNSVEAYAEEVIRWSRCGNLVAAVAEDYMCEPFILEKTGLPVAEHQRLTIERYDRLRALVPPSITIMPVLQGYTVAEYLQCLQDYGARLTPGMLVGVGSVCKRNRYPEQIAEILLAIKQARPDLRLHGFGLKTTALLSPIVQACLESADSMAWSFAARREGRDANSWKEAKMYADRITASLGEVA